MHHPPVAAPARSLRAWTAAVLALIVCTGVLLGNLLVKEGSLSRSQAYERQFFQTLRVGHSGGDADADLPLPLPPPSPAGSLLRQWPEDRSCPVYILDVSKEIAPLAGVPQCNISDPKVWPHDREGHGLLGMPTTPHQTYQHAGQYWLTAALRAAPALLTDDIDAACVVWLDTYCYNQWFHSYIARGYEATSRKTGVNPGEAVKAALSYIVETPRFKKFQGRDYAYHISHPSSDRAYSKHLCGAMLHSYGLVTEPQLACDKVGKVARRASELLPYSAVTEVDGLSVAVVGSPRPTFLYHRAGCEARPRRAPGILQRYALVQAYKGKPDVQVACTCSVCPGRKSHRQVQQDLRSSLFCPLLAGDTGSSNRLTEVILAGCIPVFMGPPWHYTPLAADADYAAFALFLRLGNTTAWIAPNATLHESLVVPAGGAAVDDAIVQVPDLEAAYRYLRALPQAEVERLQAGLERERPKFSYAPPPGGCGTSRLADIVLHNLLRHARKVGTLFSGVPMGALRSDACWARPPT